MRHLVGIDVPVLATADVVVLGADLGCLAAAVELRRAGLSVYVVEAGLSPVPDLCATGRYWIDGNDLAVELTGVAELIRRTVVGARAGTETIALWPDQVKRDLDTRLLSHGIEIGYAVTPLAVLTGEGEVAVTVGTKNGRWLVRGRRVLASEAWAGLVGAGPTEPSPWRALCLEVTGLGPDASTELTVNDWAAESWRLHPGWRGPDHAVIEIISTETAEVLESKAVDALVHLSETTSAFKQVRLAGLPLRALTDPGAPVDRPAGAPVGVVPQLTRVGPVGGRTRISETVELGAELGRTLADQITAGTPSPPSPRSGPPDSRFSGDPVHGSEGTKERPGRPRPTARCADLPITSELRTDVLVIGAGSSGLSAATHARRTGVRVLCAWADRLPGGTGTAGGVANYWFGRRTGAAREVHSAVKTLHTRLGQRGGGNGWNMAVKSLALRQILHDHEVVPLPDARLLCTVLTGDRVDGAVLVVGTELVLVRARVVVDATGDGDVAHAAGAAMRYGAERTFDTMWCSLAQFVEPGRTTNNFGGLVDVGDPEDYSRAVVTGRRRGGTLYDHGDYLAPRESRTVVGLATVTLRDVLLCTRWPDVVGVQYANYDVKGKSDSLWTLSGLIAPHTSVEIPVRALLPDRVRGLVVTGRALSTTHDGLPGIRMQSDMENLGAAAGSLAALAIQHGCDPTELDVTVLQELLTDRGVLPSQRPSVHRPTPTADQLVHQLVTGPEPWGWADLVSRDPAAPLRIPMVEAARSEDPQMDSALLAALEHSSGTVRATCAQVLVLRGHPAGADTLVGILHEAFGGAGLPRQESAIRHTQLPPDQGAMPREAYWLYTLGLARTPRALPVWQQVADRLRPADRRLGGPHSSRATLRDQLTGTFAYLDAVCYGAERLGDPRAVPILLQLHADPSVRSQVRTGPVDEEEFQERQAMLELALARALARCGSPVGFHLLVDFMTDSRALLARAAHSELVDLLGGDRGTDPFAWTRIVTDLGFRPVPQPLSTRFDLGAPDGMGSGWAATPA